MAVPSTRTASSLSRRLLQNRNVYPHPSSCFSASSSTTSTSTSNPELATSIAAACQTRRPFSSTRRAPQQHQGGEPPNEPPRWSYTPPAMKGKFRINPINNPSRTQWTVNEDPAKLDEVYVRFLGKKGEDMLPEEVKWLAVTHRSFDQGRRGFNDRLAYFGRNIIIQEAAQYILTLDSGTPTPDQYGREPFRHPALDRTNNFYTIQPMELLDKSKIAKLGTETGINQVMRWKPRLPENLAASGIDVVINQVIFAIIGAIGLQKGTATAGRIVRDRIFKRTYGAS